MLTIIKFDQGRAEVVRTSIPMTIILPIAIKIEKAISKNPLIFWYQIIAHLAQDFLIGFLFFSPASGNKFSVAINGSLSG